MHVTTLYFSSLLWQIVTSKYQNMLPNEKTEGKVVREYFDQIKNVYLERRVVRRIMIVGASVESLEQSAPLFHSNPCIICTESADKCVDGSLFSSGNMFVIFLDDLSDKTVKKSLDIISNSRESEVLIIASGMIKNEDISLLLSSTSISGVEVQFVHVENDVMKFYARVVSEDCSVKTELIAVWTPESASNIIDNWSFRSRDLNGCPVSVTTLNFPPKMLIREEKNGSLIIEGGLEGELISVIAKKLNFSISLRNPSIEDRTKLSRKAAILHDVVAGQTDIGIGRLRPTSNMFESTIVSTAYDNECMTWGVPRLVTWKHNVFSAGFRWIRWVMIGIIFIILCGSGYIAYNGHSTKTGNKKRVEFPSIVCDILSIHLGNPVTLTPVSLSGKAILISGFAYGILISTVYKTSLTSFMATDKESAAIVDAEGILRSDLSVGGGNYDLDLLKDQANMNETTSKLVDRFIVNNNVSELIRRLKMDGKFAYLTRRSALLYERSNLILANEPITFDIFGDCVLHHQTVIVFRKELFVLREAVDRVIHCLRDFGLLDHWGAGVFRTERDEQIIDEEHITSRSRKQFTDVLVIYTVCTAFSFFTFLVELGTSALRIKKQRKGAMNDGCFLIEPFP